ncbi:MAG TPA: TAT-variant-translocated molybdopterin oxidoreductase [Rubricoccaceae bacterium]|jgi:molybdopterin-containing oxidoreductase family iron-sulfur binding subunit
MIELDVLSAADLAADDDARAAHGKPLPWRSAADRTSAPGMAALRHHEFAPGAAPEAEDAETSRRTFLKVMGASVALAGLTGCRRPVETIVPYARKPQEVIPGLPNYFATAMPFGGVGHALLVQSHEGRPVKAEGNPEHPVSQGATDAFSQASILQMYDPDRSRHIHYREAATGNAGQADWAGFVAATAAIRGAGRLVVLAEPTSSPTLLGLRADLLAAAPGAQWITMGAHGDDHGALGLQAAFGRPVRPLMRFSEADVIVSFDGDFLDDTQAGVWNSREYAQSRRADARRGAGRSPMSRLYVAESTMTTTGGMADHRLRMKAGQVPFFAAAVAAGLGVDTGARGTLPPEHRAVVEAIVQDVRAAGGRAAFVAGPSQPPAVHALAAALNGRFGARTATYLDTETPPVAPVGPAIQALVRDMRAGQIGALVMLGTNPVYTLPADSGFAEAMARVPVTVHHGLYRDETGQRATWHLPAAHYLEAWGDVRALDGTLSVIQPLIAPLYADARSDVEVLNALVTGRNNAGYDLVRRTMQSRIGGIAGGLEDAWRTALHDGFVAGTGYTAVGAAAGTPSLADLRAPAQTTGNTVELVFRTHPTLHDGQFSNVAWMQEAPHPITKTTWDPVALMSRATATRLGLGQSEESGKAYCSVARFATGEGKTATMPVWIQPGHPDDSVTVHLGYGRSLATDRTIPERGVGERINTWLRPGHTETDVYRPGPIAHLAGAALDGGPTVARAEGIRSLANFSVFPGATVTKVAGDYLVASTQDHGSMEGRAIVRSGTVAEYRADPKFAQDEEAFIESTPWEAYPPLWGEENSASNDPRIGQWIYSDNQWGMTIDLNACSGCNACVVACQSENNVPTVGKEQVSRGREMHWLRVDRYYVGDEDAPGMITQPMFCQHCENAPCEQVCPVNATSHSPDGLNEMTYNRCIGTRYCANNCPYKVRRYNFYNWTKTLPIEVQMANNPYVTVRYRGVMEKCTFCVQRIRQTVQYAHIEDRQLRDGEVTTACQQACAAGAIVFGDLKDPRSAVSRSKTSPRNYAVLGELAVKPRLTYLARLRNPHPGLATPFDASEAEA